MLKRPRRPRRKCISIKIGTLSRDCRRKKTNNSTCDDQSPRQLPSNISYWLETGRLSNNAANVHKALSDLMHHVPLSERELWVKIHFIRARLAQMRAQAA